MKHFFKWNTLILLAVLLTGCGNKAEFQYKDHLLLQDLAFNQREETVYKINIEEDGKAVPYLVLTDDYNGNCLLLREHLLDETREYNPPIDYSAYYENSEIDIYLNGVFEERFDPGVLNYILDTPIEITAKESLPDGGDLKTTIIRKIFLLSYTETGNGKSRIYLEEGRSLSYFSNYTSRIAYHKNGEVGNWWLRTPCTAAHYLAGVINQEGTSGSSGIQTLLGITKSGVRPAFCLPADTPVTKQGEDYILEIKKTN